MVHKQKPNTSCLDDDKCDPPKSVVGACHPYEMDVVQNGYRPPMRQNPKHSTSCAVTIKDAIMTLKRQQIKRDVNLYYKRLKGVVVVVGVGVYHK
jgi:hypothetical protein